MCADELSKWMYIIGISRTYTNHFRLFNWIQILYGTKSLCFGCGETYFALAPPHRWKPDGNFARSFILRSQNKPIQSSWVSAFAGTVDYCQQLFLAWLCVLMLALYSKRKFMKANHVSGQPQRLNYIAMLFMWRFHYGEWLSIWRARSRSSVATELFRAKMREKRVRQTSRVTVFAGNRALDAKESLSVHTHLGARLVCLVANTTTISKRVFEGLDVPALGSGRQHKNGQKHVALSEIESIAIESNTQQQRSFMNAHTPDNSSRLIWLCCAYSHSHIIMATIHLFTRCYIIVVYV